jgi:hypothetical protein
MPSAEKAALPNMAIVMSGRPTQEIDHHAYPQQRRHSMSTSMSMIGAQGCNHFRRFSSTMKSSAEFRTDFLKRPLVRRKG